MKVNKKLAIGIGVVSALKFANTHVRAQELARSANTTLNFVEQVLRELRLAGIVTVKRGPGGGYLLNSSTPVTAYHVAKAVGGDFGTLSFDEAPVSRLRKSIIEAYLNTTI